MNKTLTRAEILAAHAMDGAKTRDGAAHDLLRAAYDLLKDSAEGQMAEMLAMLIHLDCGHPHSWNGDDILGCVDDVANLAHDLGERFEAHGDRVAS